MKLVQYTFVLCLSLLFSFCNAQDITIGNTTLTEREVAVDLQIPWEMQWGPDDHIWYTERVGKVYRLEPETGVANEILDISDQIYGGGFSEPGMLGMCFHPDFDNTPTVYVVYTKSQGGPSNKLVSFDWDGNSLSNETTILDNLNAGDVHSGSRLLMTDDGKLMITVGDGGNAALAQNMNSTGGKILRANLDGSIPSDNPDPASHIWSYGHRNPQGLHQAPSGIIYSSEHGASALDELNIISPDNNYGWPTVEGFCDDFPFGGEVNDCNSEGFTEPIFEIRPCAAINDLTYYSHPAIPELENVLLMSVMKGFSSPNSHRGLFILHLNADGTEVTFSESDDIIINNKGRIRDICINPNTGAIYVATNGNNWPSQGPNKIYEYRNMAFDSVEENGEKDMLNIFPNPSAGDVKFQINEQFIGGSYDVISYDGKKVLEGSISASNFEIEQGTLTAGSYYVVVRGNKGSISRTFIVQ